MARDLLAGRPDASERSGAEPDPTSIVDRGPRMPDAVALELVERLCGALRAEGVRYCHWKSNEALGRSASGDNDLDLLVDRRHAAGFDEILARLGFKHARGPSAKEVPSVFHAYGYDAPSGRLVHVHAQYQLVLGDDATKGYRVPIEAAYLAGATQGPLFRVASPELELLVFVIRMTLKHATWDAMASRQGRLSASERRERDDLLSSADPATLDPLVAEHLPEVDRRLWERCLAATAPRSGVRQRIVASRQLRHALAACARRTHRADTSLKTWRRGCAVIRRYVLRRRSTRKRLDRGGALIAFVGGDGAGKSTVAEHTGRWLAAGFDNTIVHLGRARWSLITLALKGGMAVGRFVGLFPSLRGSKYLSLEGELELPGYPWLLWNVLTARDRYRAYTRARRAAARGTLVICDRFPLPFLRSMDGPRATRLANHAGLSAMARRLVDRELRYYARIRYPDILIALRVDPDVAVARKRGEDEEGFVRPRSEEAWTIDWSSTSADVVDAGQPLEEVLGRVRSLIWARL